MAVEGVGTAGVTVSGFLLSGCSRELLAGLEGWVLGLGVRAAHTWVCWGIKCNFWLFPATAYLFI